MNRVMFARRAPLSAFALIVVCVVHVLAESPAAEGYRLGAGDVISLDVAEEPDVSRERARIAANGSVNVELIGRVRAGGLTAPELERLIAEKLRRFVQDPHVAVEVVEYHSRPVSVLGSVRQPGVHQLEGSKTLVEVLSAAGGVREDAGYSVTITRDLAWGPIPVAGAEDDAEGRFSVARIDLQDVVEGRAPGRNIPIMPHDVISVPRANLVYVVGAVQRSGGFALREREQISVLEALALAGGLGRVAALRRAKILRAVEGEATRRELPIDLKAIMADNAPDPALEREDILFVPSSGRKRVALTAASALVSIGTGAAIWRAAQP